MDPNQSEIAPNVNLTSRELLVIRCALSYVGSNTDDLNESMADEDGNCLFEGEEFINEEEIRNLWAKIHEVRINGILDE